MEKIKFNEHEYLISDIHEANSNLRFTVAGITDFADFRSTLTEDGLKTIEVCTEGGALCTIFEGYTIITGRFEIFENEGAMNVTVYLEKPDPVLAEIAALRAEIEQLKAEKQGE